MRSAHAPDVKTILDGLIGSEGRTWPVREVSSSKTAGVATCGFFQLRYMCFAC